MEIWRPRKDAVQCPPAMNRPYTLAKNQQFPKNITPWNIYITANKVFFIPLDKQTPVLKKLNMTYMSISAIGYRFGILGALLVVLPLDAIMHPKMEAACVSIADLERLDEVLPGV